MTRYRIEGGYRASGITIAVTLEIIFAFSILNVWGQDSEKISFRAPEEAAQALADACAEDNVNRVLGILGQAGRMLISSGDEVADKASRELLARSFREKHRLVPESADRQILHVGMEDWPVPVPIVRRGGAWEFDTMEGREELLRLRGNGNESAAISTCRLYVELQNQYSQMFYNRNNFAGLYAQKFMSDPGKQNGLYWEMKGLGKRSPADALVELAMQEGYSAPGQHPRPFHGYYFRILTAQGKDAPGGAKSYIDQSDLGFLAERKMTGGFALVAYPATYHSSGTLSFIVNQDGVVYQKDLGQDTEVVGREMAEYNPDSSWARVY